MLDPAPTTASTVPDTNPTFVTKTPLLRPLIDLIHTRHQGDEAEALCRLAEDYLDELALEPATDSPRTPAALYQVVHDCWRVLQRHAPGLQQDQRWDQQLRLLGGSSAGRHAGAFSRTYREHFSAADALQDLQLAQQLNPAQPLLSRFAEPLPIQAGCDPTLLQFKLINSGSALVLSDVVPLLELLGMQVVGEHPYALTLKFGDNEEQRYWIHNFTLRPALPAYEDGDNLACAAVQPLFREAFQQIWNGHAESDEFNRLVVSAALGWREVALLRAYARYIRQTRFGHSQPFIADSLARYPAIARLLVTLFSTRFDPNLSQRDEAPLLEQLEAALDGVESLDDDKILRRLLELIHATLRTNFFQPTADGTHKAYFSFKFDPTAISDLPLPRPKYEIFVYSPRVEGVHLRAGSVARGGLRWSDRMEDYRTEVLGLVKAQQVKNAVIVPMGAKGCFIAKQLPPGGDREQIQAEGIACYQTYIRGLLDITDNLVAGEIAPPAAVVRRDGDDPYLVVAADKGTATFSDIANAISVEYGFWLGDAFASGGSDGYDHKKMGITARGAWESVKRHFRERGLNTQTEPFSVIGIGDMAGDVFGNGMLLSPCIELVAAFNHQHIFIDPTPDCAAAFAERQRLFNLPRSAWNDYNAALISTGGGVFPRSAKRIPISPAMQSRFGIAADFLTPDGLINALLKAPVDMLWNGGIGTYVKASQETHADVGDKANDGLRINGNELGCKVLGEGGNLGFTQRGRIEFGLAGGGSNTDFIDNAGGVDCSDHEVNIKILLNEQVALGNLSLEQRNQLLREMTDEVAQLVLQNNYRQVQALSMAQRHAAANPDEYIQLIDAMEVSGKIDRALEFLPDRKTLLERREQGLGLTRPELAVLISYTKIELKQALINAWITDDPDLADEMTSAFPQRLREQFPEALRNHRLRREITATQIANDLVNRMGVTFLHNLRQATGADHAQVAAAYLIAREVYGIEYRWQAIEALDNQVDAQVQLEMMQALAQLMTRATWWFLRRRRNELDIRACLADFRAGIEQTVATVELLQQAIPSQDRWLARFQHYHAAGVPELLAAYTAANEGLYWLLDIIEVASELDHQVAQVAPLYFRLGEQLNLPWLDRQIRTYPASSHWQALARNGYRDELDAQQRAITLSALRDLPPDTPSEQVIELWSQRHAAFLRRWQHLLTAMQASPSVDCALFSVAINVLFELG
ncbi:MAG TPA: NAD-glutamate dehydrogenase [Motiliproteus sp.]